MSDEELKKVEDEIAEMAKVLEGEGDIATDPPDIQTDPPVATDPPVDDNQTDPPVIATDAPSTDAPVDYEAEYRKLLAEKDAAPKPTSPPATEAPFEEQNFLDGVDDVDEVVRDPDQLNKLLNKVFKAGVDSIKTATSKISETIPDTVKKNITLLNEITKEGDKFFEANKDLLPWRKSVATVFEELFQKTPNKKYTELMAEAAVETRKRLNLKDPKETKDDENPPKLPGKKKSSKPVDNKSKTGFDKELDDMDKALNSN